ncbi:MAG: hypothetical protein ACOC2W_01520, partial [bacterium]
MTKTNNKNTLTRPCDQCMGEGDVSSCCEEYIDNNRCSICGKFCKKSVCVYCDGIGYLEYNINDNVE